MPGLPPLRYLGEADVRASMPPLPERLRLAEASLRGLVEGGELPPKIGVRPRPEGSFAHAMPAAFRGAEASGRDDRLGMKWVLGFATNVALGLPAISGLVVLNDARTGVPIAILDAGPITAERTAAVSGVALRSYAPRTPGRATRAAIVGAGVQGKSHVGVLGHVLPGVELSIFDPARGRAEALAALARETEGVGAAEASTDARAAVEGADVVITAAPFAPPAGRQVMTSDWLEPGALVVPVDYATYCAAEVARGASLFLVDQRAQFLAARDAGHFEGYPEPHAEIGGAIAGGATRPAAGRVVVTHLGAGLVDVVFGHAILEAAEAADRGVVLPR
jgi:ornithine cyclodeaminase/alanine dehydrogenase-like protein (mu-crystallin family)